VVSWTASGDTPGGGWARDEPSRHRAARSRALPRVALVSCRELPLGDEDGPVLQAACAAAGQDTEWLVWDDPAVDWTSYDLVVIRTTWDYSPRRDDFVAWAESVPRLANPAAVVRWNTDKTYLRDLAAAGVPVVPTTWLSPGGEVDLPDGCEVVIKPTVSAGARDTARYGAGESHLARAHALALLDDGRPVMVQPYLGAVDDAGETGLLFCGGSYSHAVRKAPLLVGEDDPVDGLYREEQISPRDPAAAELALAERVLAAVPGGAGGLLYARVDLLPGADGEPLLLELELTEPSFFFGTAPGSAERFAAAVAAATATTRPA